MDAELDHWRRRAELAEADAKLAWGRVTELQAACTEHLLARREAEQRAQPLITDAESAALRDAMRDPLLHDKIWLSRGFRVALFLFGFAAGLTSLLVFGLGLQRGWW